MHELFLFGSTRLRSIFRFWINCCFICLMQERIQHPILWSDCNIICAENLNGKNLLYRPLNSKNSNSTWVTWSSSLTKLSRLASYLDYFTIYLNIYSHYIYLYLYKWLNRAYWDWNLVEPYWIWPYRVVLIELKYILDDLYK